MYTTAIGPSVSAHSLEFVESIEQTHQKDCSASERLEHPSSMVELGAVNHKRHFLNLLHSRCLFFQQSGSNTARPSFTIDRQSLPSAVLPFFEKDWVAHDRRL